MHQGVIFRILCIRNPVREFSGFLLLQQGNFWSSEIKFVTRKIHEHVNGQTII